MREIESLIVFIIVVAVISFALKGCGEDEKSSQDESSRLERELAETRERLTDLRIDHDIRGTRIGLRDNHAEALKIARHALKQFAADHPKR